MSDSRTPRDFSREEAVTPVEGHTKLSLKVAMKVCRATAKKAEEAANRLVERVSSNPPPLR